MTSVPPNTTNMPFLYLSLALRTMHSSVDHQERVSTIESLDFSLWESLRAHQDVNEVQTVMWHRTRQHH